MVAQAGQDRIRSFCSERLQFGPSSTHLSGMSTGHPCHHRKVRLPALLGPSRASHFCGWLLFCLGARKPVLCVVIPRGTHKTLLPGEERERGDTGERQEGLGVGGWLPAPCTLHPAPCTQPYAHPLAFSFYSVPGQPTSSPSSLEQFSDAFSLLWLQDSSPAALKLA